jgi:energy-coupling factor transporter ATP-binding protein EcfA2
VQRTEPRLTLVELFGAPGAGKSTLATAVARRLQLQTRHQLSAGWHRQSALRKASFIARGFATPSRMIGAARLVFGCRVRDRAGIARLFKVVAKSEWLRSQQGLVLLDQGFLQDLWSVLSGPGTRLPDPPHLSPFIRSIFPHAKTTIFFVQVDTETAFGRITARSNGHSRLDALPHAELRASIDQSADLPLAIANGAKAAGLRVVTLDGSEQIETLADQVVFALPASATR